MRQIHIFLASDHRGFALKGLLAEWLQSAGYEISDLGPASAQRCDALDFARALAGELKLHDSYRGVLICGTGQAMAMTANRFRHIRAALCFDATTARLTREHNDANVLVLGADIIGEAVAKDCLEVFLKTPFLGGRYAERRDRLTGLGGL